MNDPARSEFRQLITARLQGLDAENARGEAGQAVVTLDQQAVGRLSRMDALQNQSMAKAQQVLRDVEKTRLKQALERLETGDYGVCEDCGEDIPLGRLRLDLGATRCVSCASG